MISMRPPTRDFIDPGFSQMPPGMAVPVAQLRGAYRPRNIDPGFSQMPPGMAVPVAQLRGAYRPRNIDPGFSAAPPGVFGAFMQKRPHAEIHPNATGPTPKSWRQPNRQVANRWADFARNIWAQNNAANIPLDPAIANAMPAPYTPDPATELMPRQMPPVPTMQANAMPSPADALGALLARLAAQKGGWM